MPQNNDIVATLEDQRVITATVLYPQQGIQTQVDKVYLYNPDTAGRVFTDETLSGNGTKDSPIGVSSNILQRINGFIFDMATASDLWTIEHNLDKYPSVSVVDSGGNIVCGIVHYIDKNSLTVEFNGAFTGKAYLN